MFTSPEMTYTNHDKPQSKLYKRLQWTPFLEHILLFCSDLIDMREKYFNVN